MYKKQKIVIKNMISLSDVLANVLDDRYNKLYDRLKNLELSHNRKKKALLKIIFIIDNDQPGYNPNPALYSDMFVRIKRLCNDALFSDGRVKGVF